MYAEKYSDEFSDLDNIPKIYYTFAKYNFTEYYSAIKLFKV